MFCKNCGKYFSGLTNKVRHILARDGKKYGYDCRKLHEVPVEEAKKFLSTEWDSIEGKRVTYKDMLITKRIKPCIKINKRNHTEKSTGSDKRTADMRNIRVGRGGRY